MANILSEPNSSATKGEKSCFSRLKEYFSKDEDTLIYFEPDIINLRPDFLILSPKFGIIIIEVKDYSPDHLRTIRKSGFWTEFVDCEEKPIDNPFEQIYNYWRAVKDKVNNCRFPEKISIPIILLVAFSNISEKNEIAKKISNYKPQRIFVCWKEHLRFQKKFSEFISDIVPCEYILSKKYFDILKGNLFPECRLPELNQKKITEFLTPEDRIKLLDLEQEKLARKLGPGHRLVFGVAGSGKTVLLIARARILALRHPDWKILILCYNKLLKNYLFHLLNPLDYDADITINTFHGWARRYILSGNDDFSKIFLDSESLAKRKGKIDDFFREFVPKLLLDVIKSRGDDKLLYDAILIDEAQDFEQMWFKAIISVLNPETNSLLITCDGLQGIYARKKFTWASVGIKAVGRSLRLQKSYRTPIEIGIVAQKILPERLQSFIGRFDEFLPTTEFLGENGSVEIMLAKSRSEEYKKLAEKIERLAKLPQEIIILFKSNMAKKEYQHPLFEYFKKFKINWIDLSKYNYQIPGILIGTLHGTKGLEFSTIIIPEFDSYTSEKDRQLLYVGITRATKRLIISAVSNNSRKDNLIKLLKQD